jgi:hypothetical protein
MRRFGTRPDGGLGVKAELSCIRTTRQDMQLAHRRVREAASLVGEEARKDGEEVTELGRRRRRLGRDTVLPVRPLEARVSYPSKPAVNRASKHCANVSQRPRLVGHVFSPRGLAAQGKSAGIGPPK